MVRKRKTQLPGARDLSSEPDGAAGAQTPAEQQQTQQQPLARQQPQPPRQQAGYQGQGGSGYAHRGRPLQGRGVVAPQQQAPRGIAPSQRGAGSGPVYAPTPELHQATDAPQQPRVTMQPVRAESSSTSSSNQPVHKAMAQLKPPSAAQQEESVVHAATALSKALTPPLRPGKGVLGKRCIVKANHFFVELSKKDLHHYDVTITPEGTSCRVKRAVIAKLVEQYKESLGGCVPAYDGFKHLYTAGALPFVSQEFQIKLLYESGERGFAVAIKFVACLDLRHLKLFLQGTHADATGGVIQSLNTVLRQLPTNPYIAVGRSFYSPKSSQTQPLGGGLEAWRGFYQSVRPTQMGLSLNIDICAAAFIEPVCVIEFVSQLLKKTATGRPLSSSDCAKIEEALRGILIEVTHRANRRKHRVRGLTSRPTRELDFPVDGGRKSVVDYFLEKHDIKLKHVQWPCLDVGNSQRPNYLPMEVCNIVAGQKYSMMLNKEQISRFLTVTCQRPQVRERDIKTVCSIFEDDPCAKEFGIEINSELTSVEARRLVPPSLKYHDTGREKVCSPQMGVWNMRNKKLVNGGRVDNWISICFDPNVSDNTAGAFYHALTKECNYLGMDFNPYPVLPAYRGSPSRSEEVLKSRFLEALKKLQPQKKELDLLICILPDNNGDLYGDLKRICETDLGIVSQCCLTTHVFKMNAQYLTNVALKINVKVGGRNTVLVNAISMRIPNVGNVPTIIFGADVTHPHRGDHSPSIAAVVASQDWPEITKYAGLVCAQQPRLELIQDLYKESQGANGQKVYGGMIRELLMSFYKATGHKPGRIIFYRDGVGEREFDEVLLFELDAIRKACNSLQADYQPLVTFVVVQKRNNTRLFADNHDPDATDKSGNILPGTVVDSEICHPREFDFYLCSHAGVVGTSRPVHYHVLWDENKFQADALQSLTNNLCYTYARCTRSVSIVPPVYYAHLAAFRARFYVNTEPETSLGANAAVRPLPPLKENVKRVMFYC